MKVTLLTATVLALAAMPSGEVPAARPNAGGNGPAVFEGHDLTLTGGVRVLYAPSEGDDPVYRAGIATCIGGTVDYFDARYGTPSLGLLLSYDCVHTWASYAYLDASGFGDVLADYVDAGGKVVLGAFCTYTLGNCLAGRIMTSGYCPVVSPSGGNHFSPSSYAGDGTTCIHTDVESYQCMFRDYLVAQGPGVADGHYLDQEIAHAYRPDYAVIYSNGGGDQALGGIGDWTLLIANCCGCRPGTPAESTTWGSIKELYR